MDHGTIILEVLLMATSGRHEPLLPRFSTPCQQLSTVHDLDGIAFHELSLFTQATSAHDYVTTPPSFSGSQLAGPSQHEPLLRGFPTLRQKLGAVHDFDVASPFVQAAPELKDTRRTVGNHHLRASGLYVV